MITIEDEHFLLHDGEQHCRSYSTLEEICVSKALAKLLQSTLSPKPNPFSLFFSA